MDDAKYPVVFRGVTVEENCAIVGGGIDIYATATLNMTSHRGSPTVIRGNLAVNGGGLYLEPGHYITLDVLIHDTHFQQNKVRRYEESEIARLVREGHGDGLPWGIVLQERFNVHTADEEDIAQQLTVHENGQGGGICLNLIDIHVFTIADIVMQNVLIEGNEANVGGSILCSGGCSCVTASGCGRRHVHSVF